MTTPPLLSSTNRRIIDILLSLVMTRDLGVKTFGGLGFSLPNTFVLT
jgi:hypothetical protein